MFDSYISGYKNRFQNFIKHLREMGDEVYTSPHSTSSETLIHFIDHMHFLCYFGNTDSWGVSKVVNAILTFVKRVSWKFLLLRESCVSEDFFKLVLCVGHCGDYP